MNDDTPRTDSVPVEETKPESVNDTIKANFEELKSIVEDDDVKIDPKDTDRFFNALTLFFVHPEDVEETLAALKTKEMPTSAAKLAILKRSITEAYRHYQDIQRLRSPFTRDESFWRQSLTTESGELGPGRPRFSTGKTKHLGGDTAAMRVRAAAGLGTVITAPLWHTGIWVKVKALSSGTLHAMERRIANEKITLGRQTNGVVFSSTSVYTTNIVANTILNNVLDTSYSTNDVAALKRIIKITDLPQLIWAAAAATWPNGKRLVRPCVHDPMNCQHIDEAKINVGRLSWVDNRALNSYQQRHMSRRDDTIDDEALAAYTDNHVVPQSKIISTGSGMSIRLKIPTIAEYEEAGFSWVDGIVRMTDEAFGRELRGDDRTSYIEEQGTLSSLRRYAHWIDAVIFDDDDAEIIAREDIDQALDSLSSQEDISDTIVDAIESFQRDVVISAIGIPRYDCPACNNPAPEDDSPKRLPEIIQLEVLEVFFTLTYMGVTQQMMRT